MSAEILRQHERLQRTSSGNVGTRTLYIEPRSPWENGYCASFNGKLRAEFLNGEIAEGGGGSDGAVARRIQYRAAAFGVGLQAAGASGMHPNA